MSRPRLSKKERDDALLIFRGVVSDRNNVPRSGCVHCAGIHDVVDGLPPARQPCPRVKKITWNGDEITSVTYWRHGEWDSSDVIFPTDVFEDEEAEAAEAEETPDGAREPHGS